jgi:uncharacterized protein YPO0396
MSESLFGLIPTASDGRQWTARSMQLVNWGGYHGHHEVRFATTATLLSGASGSGKSTLLDAYIALMMSHTTPFNGASNGATAGRARGREQRNVLSYARGKLDESREDGQATARDRVLRGDGVDTWSAIAMTWVDQSGETLTALRAWYVPRGAVRNEDCVVVRATHDGAFDLRALEPLAAGRFARAALTDAGLALFDTDLAFATRLHTALGIGAAGDGHKAVQLLGRIQAGQQITTVDALYKAMVLEEPETLEVADRAVEHFDELSAVRTEMLTASRQVEVLRPMLALRAQLDESAASVALIDTLGVRADDDAEAGPTPFTAWRDARRLALVRAEEEANRTAYRAAEERRTAAASRIAQAEAELEEVREARRRQGGDAIEAAERDVRRRAERLEEVRTARAALDVQLAVVEREVASRTDFERLQRDARASVDARAEEAAALEEEVWAARQTVSDAERRLATLEREQASLAQRRGNVGAEDHAARCALAEAAGLPVEELPFVAELLEVRGEYEPWRDAIGLALGGFATTLLVDAARLDDFRGAIDGVPLRRRLRFEGVTTGLALDVDADPRTLPGRLEVKAGPFGGWLARRLAERFAYVCVDDPAELRSHPRALTRTGQVSDGARGEHGGSARASVLGFSNARRLERLADDVAAARTALRDAGAALEGARLRQAAHTDRFVAYSQVLRVAWDDVDVAGAQEVLDERRERLASLTSGSDVLRALADDESRLRTRLTELYRERADAENRVRELGEQWAAITELVDHVTDAVERAERAGVAPTDAQRERLEGALAAVAPGPVGEPGLGAFTAATAAVVRELVRDREAATEAERAARAALRSVFERFCDAWPNPNLGTDPDASYADFLRIYSEIEDQRLYQLQERWSRTIGRLSGNDLTLLGNVMTRAVAEIRERMEPVNAILATLPFRDDEHRLRITATVTEAQDVVSFRRRLRELAQPVGEQTPAERQRRYERMARLIDRIRPDSPERRRLVDVRDHVRISAECVDLEGNHVSVYDHIAGKSGGESQELVAFIVGAALRYQLGDAGAERPRYAPVFLDEAFIKADARFAGRAVGAWRGLGFQLVVGAPLDKVGALEPHVDVVLQAVKDDAGRSRIVTLVGA